MCGIVGVLNKGLDHAVDRSLLEKMTKIIDHRGPDGFGTYYNSSIGFGHRRLSVIDVDFGSQPMIDSETRRTIIFNGEIYNYKQLRSELIKSGNSFNTHSDTEVLLKFSDFSDFGRIEELNGMFAYAIWDEKEKSLLLVRDRLGIKPLYYADMGGVFIFGSEIKSLLLHPQVVREPNTKRIFEYLAFRDIAGNETAFNKIYQIPPGHAAKLCAPNYTLKFIKYWREGDNFPTQCIPHEQNDFRRHFTHLLSESIKSRLISDVPVGTFNSGGVDSSLVSAIVRKHKKDGLHTFSVGFEEAEFDERKHAQTVADHLGSTHHTVVVSQSQYCDAIDETLWHLEEPINHAHTVQLLHLSKLAKQFVTVVLTGEGADELFGGYPRYNLPILAGYLPKSSRRFLSTILTPLAESLGMRRLVKLFEAFGQDSEGLIINNARFVPQSTLARLTLSHSHQSFARQNIYQSAISHFGDNLNAHLYYDQRTYLSSLLTRLDKMSMGAGLEARVPFLDHRLVEWSYELPPSAKIRFLRNKWIVKRSAEEWLPSQIVYRKKVGFGAPVAQWLRSKNGLGRFLDILTDQTFKERAIIEPASIKSIMIEHTKSIYDHSELLWGLINLELWHRRFIDNAN